MKTKTVRWGYGFSATVPDNGTQLFRMSDYRDRIEALDPWVGKEVCVQYRTGMRGDARVVTGKLIGAAQHCTNNNSTGDLVVLDRYHGGRVAIIGLAHVLGVEAAP